MSVPYWKSGGEPYIDVIENVAAQCNLPTDLLSRVAFQECSWRIEVIDYSTPSPAGALGMFQLMPADFPQVLRKRGWAADGADAAAELARLERHFSDWQYSIAAYNWGQGNVDHWIARGAAFQLLPTQTRNYLNDVFTDVPIAGAILNA